MCWRRCGLVAGQRPGRRRATVSSTVHIWLGPSMTVLLPFLVRIWRRWLVVGIRRALLEGRWWTLLLKRWGRALLVRARSTR
jgi:hypothetical protein